MIVPWDMTPREIAEAIIGGRQDLFDEAARLIDEEYSAEPFCRDMFFELCVQLEEKYADAVEMPLYQRAASYAGLFPE